MSNYRALITNFTPGSAKEVEFIIQGPPDGLLINGAEFIVKSRPEDNDDVPVVFKEITLTDTPGVGFISDNGSGGTFTVRVDLTNADTIAIAMNRMSFYLQLATTSFPAPYIPYVGTIAANAKSIAL